MATLSLLILSGLMTTVAQSVSLFFSDPFGWKDFSRENLTHALPRVLFAVGFWIFGVYANNVSQAWLQKTKADYYEKTYNTTHLVLWDAGFYITPVHPSAQWCDTVAGSIPIIVFCRFCLIPGPYSMRWTIFSRIMLIWGILWFLRGITIIATVLPNPDNGCKPQISFPDNIWLEAWANLPFVFWYHELTCQDVLFSGHTV